MPPSPPPLPWQSQVRTALDGAPRVLVLGVGSVLRGDDGAGPLLVRRLRRVVRGGRKGRLVGVVDGHVAPENFSGEIKRRRPTHVVIVDSARFRGEPGDIEVIPMDEAGGVPFCSHALPVGLLAWYLQASTGAVPLILGVQPGPVEFGTEAGPAIHAAVERLAEVLLDTLGLLPPA